MGADCKSAGLAFEGSNPSPSKLKAYGKGFNTEKPIRAVYAGVVQR